MAVSCLWQSLIIFSLLWLGNYNAASYVCKNLTLQNCTKLECTPNTYSFECPRIEPGRWNSLLKIKVEIGEEVYLECDSHVVDYEWLNDINVGLASAIDIKSCPMEDITISSFIQKLNITGVKSIRITNGFTDPNLNHTYFYGVENITHLLLPYNQFTKFPAELFQNMKNLTNLDLHHNNLTLKNNELAAIQSLKKLDLGENNIYELIPGTFQNLKRLEYLNLWGNRITILRKEMFVGLENLQSLEVGVNHIFDISSDAFNALKNLKTLSLMKNNFTELPKNIFSSTINLEEVRLHNNEKLRVIPEKLFAGLPSLLEIKLRRCNLSSIPDNIFWDSPKLSNVDLSGNSLQTLPPLLFRDTENLKEVDISNNQIHFLAGSTFSGLKKMQTLDLRSNKLTSLDEELFQKLEDLQSLFINNNEIEHIHPNTFHALKKLRILEMAHNNISFQEFLLFDSSPLAYCMNLEKVDLSHNKIQSMFSDWMWILNKLQSLDLSYNNFTYLNAQSLQFLSSHVVVNLEFNKIRTIDLTFLEAMSSQNKEVISDTEISVINLKGNELKCDCTTYDILRYRERRMQPIVYQRLNLDIDDLKCTTPSHLSGYPISKLSSKSFTCDWRQNKKCPSQCQCSEWLSVKHLIVNCTGVGLVTIPDEILEPQFAGNLIMDLIFDHNSLNSLPRQNDLHETNTTSLSLAHNYISWIDNGVFPNTLKELKLDNNNMSHINSSLMEFFTNRTNLTLHNNPWNCDCESLSFLSFLQSNFKQIEQLQNINCTDGSNLALLTAEEMCPFDRTATIIISSTIGVVGILIGLLAALFFCYQNEVKVWLYAHHMCLWFVTEEELDKDKIYDAFISYSHQDEEFVSTKLLPELEKGTPPFKICVHYRDWVVGEFITTQIARSVEDSKRTIIVLSKNFIKSEWGRLEFRAAHKQALTEKRARVLVVLYGDLGPLENLDSELRSYLSTNTYVKWGDPWFWDKLRYALPHQRSPVQSKYDTDKLDLINSSAKNKSSTPPADVAVNPLEIITNFSNRQCKILNELNGSANKNYINKDYEISVKVS